MPGFRAPSRDPRDVAPVGTWLKRGKQLVRVVQVDHLGALVEDALSSEWFHLAPVDLLQQWTKVRPDESTTVASWRAFRAQAQAPGG